jgi:hypothetical protein
VTPVWTESSRRRPRQAANSGSFLKKRTKKLCALGFGLSWRIEAEIFKSFLLLFFKKEVLAF